MIIVFMQFLKTFRLFWDSARLVLKLKSDYAFFPKNFKIERFSDKKQKKLQSLKMNLSGIFKFFFNFN